MKLLEDKILSDGKILEGDVLKVDHFLNHQIDVLLLDELGQELSRRFLDAGVTKVLTIEASGIAVACLVARQLRVPMLFAKKMKHGAAQEHLLSCSVEASAGKHPYDVVVSREYLRAEDKVLVIDDFLAKGDALRALIGLIEQSGAELVGCGIVIERAFQGGGDDLRAKGVRIESLAKIASMSVAEGITFC
ncbi:MAG: xanthine phosphoribosyltransferase [Ruminococcaceae bacterium]|nr:xanthine phosphoribosyltransferase [Oscillospiraceae bacterium]